MSKSKNHGQTFPVHVPHVVGAPANLHGRGITVLGRLYDQDKRSASAGRPWNVTASPRWVDVLSLTIGRLPQYIREPATGSIRKVA